MRNIGVMKRPEIEMPFILCVGVGKKRVRTKEHRVFPREHIGRRSAIPISDCSSSLSDERRKWPETSETRRKSA